MLEARGVKPLGALTVSVVVDERCVVAVMVVVVVTVP